MVRMENWAVVFAEGSPYLPPDLRPRKLHGDVYGHPDFEDGHRVLTSVIVASSRKTEDGHVVQTASREYLLGAPSKKYLEWLKAQDIDFDAENPIKFED
ncbi:MAG TPA: hypothetical protein V6C89_10310 [Drouetiella sp.]|jgi:hypothetical protein